MKVEYNIFTMIEGFWKHPAGYTSDFGFRELESFVNGYLHALLAHDIDEPGTTFETDFTEFLRSKNGTNKQSSTDYQNWCNIITDNTKNDKEAYFLFFKSIKEFRSGST